MLSNLRMGWAAVILPAFVVLSLVACRSSSDSKPVIEFTEVPVAGAGGPGRMTSISGKTFGAGAGDMIVLYAKSQRWWVQPFADKPLTPVGSDGTWTTKIHLGTEYAALLVHPGFHPPAVSDTLPAQGGDVLAVATVKGKDSPRENAILSGKSRTIQFSGYEWQ